MSTSAATPPLENDGGRETFNSRFMFLMAAIGSAVGLGNIWRFPYTAYENGGGVFLIPYLVALLTAGIPLLWFELAVGHRYRGSAPLAMRRIGRWAEPIGWMKVFVNFFIAIYYAVIIAWAGIFALKSITKAWGDDPNAYFFEDFLKADTASVWSGDFLMPVLIAMIIIWALCIWALASNINKGIGLVTSIAVPLLVVLFAIIVLRALFLPGALDGLDTLFRPDWSQLTNTSVWIAAYGQIFFSLSVGFGIMLTYSSYLKPRTNLSGTGLVTAFANSSFEVLAGIGVFATLGFMALQTSQPVGEVATGGIGLAFIAFPAVINEMPFGEIFGIFFFTSLFLAGITSLISILEVVISAVKEKFGLSRRTAALGVGGVMAVLSITLFSTTSGIVTLDIMDKYTNNLGIVMCALLFVTSVGLLLKRQTEFAQHINAVSQISVGIVWRVCVFGVTPALLTYFLIKEVITLINEPYEGYSSSQLTLFGWAVMAVIIIGGILMSFVKYPSSMTVSGLPSSDYGVPVGGRPSGTPNSLGNGPLQPTTLVKVK